MYENVFILVRVYAFVFENCFYVNYTRNLKLVSVSYCSNINGHALVLFGFSCSLVLLPANSVSATAGGDFWTILWIIVVNDFVLMFISILLKMAVVIFYHLAGLNARRKVQYEYTRTTFLTRQY